FSLVSMAAIWASATWFVDACGHGSGRPGFNEVQLAHHLVPHHKLLHLAGHGQGHLVDKADVARDLVMGDLVAAELADVVFGGACARLGHDPRAYFFAILRVRHAEYLDRLDLGVAEQEFLDLARVDVLAAADQHVLHAADDIAVAFVVDGGQVTGMHPAIADGFGGAGLVVPVARHDRIAARAQLALL